MTNVSILDFQTAFYTKFVVCHHNLSPFTLHFIWVPVTYHTLSIVTQLIVLNFSYFILYDIRQKRIDFEISVKWSKLQCGLWFILILYSFNKKAKCGFIYIHHGAIKYDKSFLDNPLPEHRQLPTIIRQLWIQFNYYD